MHLSHLPDHYHALPSVKAQLEAIVEVTDDHALHFL